MTHSDIIGKYVIVKVYKRHTMVCGGGTSMSAMCKVGIAKVMKAARPYKGPKYHVQFVFGGDGVYSADCLTPFDTLDQAQKAYQ